MAFTLDEESFKALAASFGLKFKQNGCHCMVRSNTDFKVDFWPTTGNVHVNSPGGLRKISVHGYQKLVEFLEPFFVTYSKTAKAKNRESADDLLLQNRQHLWIEVYLETHRAQDADEAVELFNERFAPRDIPVPMEEEQEDPEAARTYREFMGQ